MTPQTEQDIHLMAAPFRFVSEWFKILAFFAVLPLVFIVSFVYWLATGTPIMSPDEIEFAKWALILSSPAWLTAAGIIIWKLAIRAPSDKADVAPRLKEIAEAIYAGGDPIDPYALLAVCTENKLDMDDLIAALSVVRREHAA